LVAASDAQVSVFTVQVLTHQSCMATRNPIIMFSLTSSGMMMGDDPHFSVVLPSEKLLCFSVQGDHGFSYNLISNRMLHMNAIFIPDSRRAEVTWIGTLGIVITDSSTKGANETSLLFEIKTQRVTVNNKVKIIAKNIDKITRSIESSAFWKHLDLKVSNTLRFSSIWRILN